MQPKIPSRFQPNPNKKEAWRFRLLLGKSGLPTKAQVDQFGELLMLGDPLDDQLADWAESTGFMKARALLDKALDEGIKMYQKRQHFCKIYLRKSMLNPLGWIGICWNWVSKRLVDLASSAP